jgi:hypothetical protein
MSHDLKTPFFPLVGPPPSDRSNALKRKRQAPAWSNFSLNRTFYGEGNSSNFTPSSCLKSRSAHKKAKKVSFADEVFPTERNIVRSNTVSQRKNELSLVRAEISLSESMFPSGDHSSFLFHSGSGFLSQVALIVVLCYIFQFLS